MHNFAIRHGVALSVRLLWFGWSKWHAVGLGPPSREPDRLALEDDAVSSAKRAPLVVCDENDATPAHSRRLTLFSEWWLRDFTGLGLTYADPAPSHALDALGRRSKISTTSAMSKIGGARRGSQIPKFGAGGSEARTAAVGSDMRLAAMQTGAVTEEIYENQRLGLKRRTWSEPWAVGDRPEWSDARGKRRLARGDVRLPSGGWWRWDDAWRVDSFRHENARLDARSLRRPARQGRTRPGSAPRREALDDDDEHGWVYGTHWAAFPDNEPAPEPHEDVAGAPAPVDPAARAGGGRPGS